MNPTGALPPGVCGGDYMIAEVIVGVGKELAQITWRMQN